MRQNLGQHFLKNKVVIDEIVNAIDPEPGDIIIEVGTGHGELTLPLAKQCPECSILTIEKDPSLAREFMRASEGLAPENITLIEGDARELIPELLEKHVGKTVKLVGNLPYYLTNFLLRQLANATNKPERCVFTIQKEVAKRLSAQPPNMSKLSAAVQWWAKPVVLGFIHAADFDPPPEVDGAVVLLLAREHFGPVSSEQYYRTLQALFRHPRKTILNNLAAAEEATQDKASLQRALEQIGIDPNARPETLSVEHVAQIAEKLSE